MGLWGTFQIQVVASGSAQIKGVKMKCSPRGRKHSKGTILRMWIQRQEGSHLPQGVTPSKFTEDELKTGVAAVC